MDADERIHISYYDQTNKEPLYTRQVQAGGSSNALIWMKTTIDESGNVGGHSDLSLNEMGQGYVSYYDATNQQLKLASNQGDFEWKTTVMDSTSISGHYTSIVVDDGLGVHIVYFANSSNQSELRYIKR